MFRMGGSHQQRQPFSRRGRLQLPAKLCELLQLTCCRGTFWGKELVSKLAKGVIYHVFCMSMNGETCRALGTLWPSGLKRKMTFAAQGVFVTSAMHWVSAPSLE